MLLSDRKLSRVVFSSAKDTWGTPPLPFNLCEDDGFRFALDVAATKDNAMVEAYLGPDHEDPARRDALTVSWRDALRQAAGRRAWRRRACWLNPPYTRRLQKRFIAKAALESRSGVTTVMLLPARTDTQAFHTYIYDRRSWQPREGVEIRFLRGRLKFVGAANGAPFPSMLVIFRGEPVGRKGRA